CGKDISVRLPVPPGNDLFGAMNDEQRKNLHARQGELLKALREAKAESSATKAAEGLRRYFGEDFPVPKKAGALGAAGALGTSGASA
ncbi:MAG: hypothetical protein KC457_33365, partial [Myxococcales bacterium]|nr:hypothetical protein [Myxococcales bacterium]